MQITHTDVISKLPSCFEDAVNTGDLLFFPSTISTHTDSDVEVSNHARSYTLGQRCDRFTVSNSFMPCSAKEAH